MALTRLVLLDIMNCSECEDGDDGDDGVSCSASTSTIAATDVSPGGTRVTITCGKKSTSFDIHDGSDGADGQSCTASASSVYDSIGIKQHATKVTIKCGLQTTVFKFLRELVQLQVLQVIRAVHQRPR